jgi:hypothetical protein
MGVGTVVALSLKVSAVPGPQQLTHGVPPGRTRRVETVDREGLEYALETAAGADPRALGIRRPDRGFEEEV